MNSLQEMIHALIGVNSRAGISFFIGCTIYDTGVKLFFFFFGFESQVMVFVKSPPAGLEN